LLPALSSASTVNVFMPKVEVSIGDPLGTLPVHDFKPEPPASTHEYTAFACSLRTKVGEEAVEAALAAVTEDDERLVAELTDLWFHAYVRLAARGLDSRQVEDKLARRAR
jgi:phosphoribosyl-ATP pyrophosphohydrolase